MLLSKATYMSFQAIQYIFFVSMCSLGTEPTTFARLTQCSTTEPQGLYVGPIHSIYNNINTF